MSTIFQALTATLANAIDATQTTIPLRNFKDSRGVAITSLPALSLVYATIEPLSSINQEIISFTGVTDNGNGLVTLTGVTRNLNPRAPYTAMAANVPHGNSAPLIVSNNPAFYNNFLQPDINIVITGLYQFPDPTLPQSPVTLLYSQNIDAQNVKITGAQAVAGVKTFASSPIVPTPTNGTDAANKAYVDGVALAGAPNASTTVKGVSEEATQAEFDAGTDVGTTGARLFVVPSVIKTINNVVLVAGEALTLNDSVFVANGNETRQISAFSTTVSASESLGSGVNPNWIYQSFTTGPNTTKISRVRLYGAYSGNFPNSGGTVRIRSTPSGSDLVSASFGLGVFLGSEEIDLGLLTVTPSTTYYIVVSLAYTDPSINKIFRGSASSTYSGGSSAYSTNAGVSWGACTNVTGDFAFQILEGDYVAGRAYKTIAAQTDNTGSGFTANFIGFALATVAASANVSIKVTGIMSGLSGLAAGITYFISNIAGALSVSAGTVSKKVGIALTTTSLLIKNENN